jgi:hypothetical protein
MKGTKHRNKGSLQADREKRKVHNIVEGFGIYRPVTDDTLVMLGGFSRHVADDFSEYLVAERESFSQISTKEDFGFTLARYVNIQKKLAEAIISGFEIGRLVDSLPNDALTETLDLTVKDIDWYHPLSRYKEARVMVMRFEKTSAFYVIEEQCKIIAQSLGKVGITGVVTEPKDYHLTLLHYGEYGDKQRITRQQAAKGITIANDLLHDYDIHTVSVEPLTIGDGYRSNLPSISGRLEAIVPQF